MFNNEENNGRTFHPYAGLWSGIGELLNDQGQYYVQSNWKGNGLANTGLGLLQNPNYRDPFSAGQALAQDRNRNKKDKSMPYLSTIFRYNRPYGSLTGAIYDETYPKYDDIYDDNVSKEINRYDYGSLANAITSNINNDNIYNNDISNYIGNYMLDNYSI